MLWHVSPEFVSYEEATASMEAHVAEMALEKADEKIWLLEHPPLYTAGTSHKEADLLPQASFPVYQTGRGGEWTYHGPGQRIAYVMMDLKKREACDIRGFIQALEGWIIASLADLDVTAFRDEEHIGVWVMADGTPKKIAAIGVRVRKWITFHGVAINIQPDLSHYQGIIPCGIADKGVTSLHDLGVDITMADFDKILQKNADKCLNLGKNSVI